MVQFILVLAIWLIYCYFEEKRDEKFQEEIACFGLSKIWEEKQ